MFRQYMDVTIISRLVDYINVLPMPVILPSSDADLTKNQSSAVEGSLNYMKAKGVAGNQIIVLLQQASFRKSDVTGYDIVPLFEVGSKKL